MPTPAERLALAIVPRLRAALAGVPGCDGLTVQARPDTRPQQGDTGLTVVVTVGPPKLTPATGEPGWAWFGHYPTRATAVYHPPVTPPGGTPPAAPFMDEVRGVVLKAMLHFLPLLTDVPELDGADPTPELERGWFVPAVGSSVTFTVAGVTFRTQEPL